MRMIFMLSILFAVSPASAQQVYKCVNGSQVSYQSAACDDKWKVARKWDAPPDPISMADQRRHRQPRSQSDGPETSGSRRATGDRTRSVSSGGARPSEIQHVALRCGQGTSRSEAEVGRVKRTFDLLRKLDDAVNEACKQ